LCTGHYNDNYNYYLNFNILKMIIVLITIFKTLTPHMPCQIGWRQKIKTQSIYDSYCG
jgi:hypothetical protein